MRHVKTTAPRSPMSFERIEGPGFVLYVETEIKAPMRWLVVRKRFPWTHFDALYDPVTHGSKLDAIIDGWGFRGS